jgi:hypothetical protein
MKKARCLRCQAEYDALDDAVSKAIGGLCAACWHGVHIENKILKVMDKSASHNSTCRVEPFSSSHED